LQTNSTLAKVTRSPASLFLCVSEYIREKAIRAGFPVAKVRMQYTGMNCDAFTPSLPLSEKDPNLVLYVGRLVPYKGCDYLLRAMKLVQQQRSDVGRITGPPHLAHKDRLSAAEARKMRNLLMLGLARPITH
jgi:glycosyltransferase involved in cell wall biosynthesis